MFSCKNSYFLSEFLSQIGDLTSFFNLILCFAGYDDKRIETGLLQMLEIVFDENASCEFLGQKCQTADVDIAAGCDWETYRKAAAQLVAAHTKERVVVINFSGSEKMMNYLALALGVETYEEQTELESVVFKVGDSQKALSDYKPFMALANSLRYARDLLRLPEAERRADIKRLGYLGLKVKEDYIKETITIDWPGKKPEKKMTAEGALAALVLVGVMKKQAICKDEQACRGIIGKVFEKEADKIAEPKDENEMIEKIIEKCEEI